MRYRGGNVRSTFDCGATLWALNADPGQMAQVFSNLVLNARQAMPDGGILMVTADNLLLESASPLPLPAGRYVRIAIADQGLGIAPEHLPKIFDPYFTTKPTGSGLGLAMTYSVIQQHGGHITVTSTLGMGTTFTLYLPAADALPRRQEPKQDVMRGQGRLLVLEDDTTIQELVRAMLEYLGYTITLCPEGMSTIAAYQEAQTAGTPFDAVLLDLTIRGGMGGLETLRHLLTLDPHVKAIVTSGYSDDPAVMAECRAQGFRAAIPKPYRLRTLSQIVQRVLQETEAAG